jgi:hypothetical protein
MVEFLVHEFQQPRPMGQPVILEDVTPETHSIRVTVIDAEWANVPVELRAPIIIEAYERAEGKEKAQQITLASGLTGEEAVRMGLLPYKLVPAPAKGEAHHDMDYWNAFPDKKPTAQPITMVGAEIEPVGFEYRFAAMEDALEAKRVLQQQLLPGSHWALIEERYAPGD